MLRSSVHPVRQRGVSERHLLDQHRAVERLTLGEQQGQKRYPDAAPELTGQVEEAGGGRDVLLRNGPSVAMFKGKNIATRSPPIE